MQMQIIIVAEAVALQATKPMGNTYLIPSQDYPEKLLDMGLEAYKASKAFIFSKEKK